MKPTQLLLPACLLLAPYALAQDELYEINDIGLLAVSQLGDTVAVDGTRVIAGAPFSDVAAVLDGGVYVFDLVSGDWVSGGSCYGEFNGKCGDAVAIDGVDFAFGTEFSNWYATAQGLAFHGVIGGGGGELLGSGVDAGDRFGSAVAIGGGRIAVGARTDEVSGVAGGAVYLFDAATNQQIDILFSNDLAANDGFGGALAADGDTLLARGGGAVYVFDMASGQQLQKLTPPSGSGFGTALALAGGRAFIGNPSGTAASPGGVVFVYELSSGSLLTTIAPSVSVSGMAFGTSVAAAAGKVLVGAPLADTVLINGGEAYLFDADGGPELAILRPADQETGDETGRGVGLSAQYAVVGSPQDDDMQPFAGSLTVFEAGPVLGVTECIGVPNSTGVGGVQTVTGSALLANDDVLLTARNLPNNQFAMFLASRDPGFVMNPAGSSGNLCLGGQIARIVPANNFTGNVGRIEHQLDLSNIPTTPAVAVQAGDTWYFQAWYRDLNPGPTSNFTSSARVRFF